MLLSTYAGLALIDAMYAMDSRFLVIHDGQIVTTILARLLI